MSDPDHTAARLIAAAERLFAEGGEEATSLRAITREARSNAAAVHYHFGGRDELLRAVLDQHLGPLAERRSRLLDLAKANHGEPVPVAALIEAAVRPDLELLAALRGGKVQVARFLGRANTLPGAAVGGFVERQFGTLARQVLPMLRQSLPALDEDHLRQRLRLVMATVVFLFATAPDRDTAGPLGTDDIDEQVRRLVGFCAAGMSAPAGAAQGKKGLARGMVAANDTSTARARKRASDQPSTPTGTAKIGTAKTGTAKTDTEKIGTAKTGTAKTGTEKIGTEKIGTAKTGTEKSGDRKRKKR
jgi:AcrR family transcriptional regulator